MHRRYFFILTFLVGEFILMCKAQLLFEEENDTLRLNLSPSIEDPVGSIFMYPFVMGPAAIIGLAALLTGPIGWTWVEVSFGVYGKKQRDTIANFLDSVLLRLQKLNNDLDIGFQSVLK